MTFTTVSIVAAVATILLGLGNIFVPSTMMTRWGLFSYRVDPKSTQPPTVFLSRRIGAIYLGLAVMFIVGRDAPPSRLRDAICIGLGIALILIATTGIIERVARRVSNGILVPTSFEILLAASFFWVATR